MGGRLLGGLCATALISPVRYTTYEPRSSHLGDIDGYVVQ